MGTGAVKRASGSEGFNRVQNPSKRVQKIIKFFQKISIYFPESRLIKDLRANAVKKTLTLYLNSHSTRNIGLFGSPLHAALLNTWLRRLTSGLPLRAKRPLSVRRVQAPFIQQHHYSRISVLCKGIAPKSFLIRETAPACRVG
jgi:hypothetical protein